ncbi:MAG TPA: GNAT family N-acetyltransferase [Acidobacteriota bacterium]|nr:GNAT family N-acetyltransferase [Acidobacteriota bacterium]
MSQSPWTVPVIEPLPLQIRRAVPSEAPTLTTLCRAAKRHWGYPDEWMDAWADTVRVTPAAIRSQLIFVACGAGDPAPVGFFGLRREGSQWCLEHFWVTPAQIGRGVGRAMFGLALATARRNGARELQIKSDPNAEGFYRRMGARRVGEQRYLLLEKYPRELPLLVVDVSPAS